MLAIFKRELRAYFTGVIGYVFLVIYLALAGVAFCYTTLFAMSSDVTAFYTIMMRTEALLLTAPVSLPAMVLGKFLASFVVFAAAELVTTLYFLFLIPYAKLKFAVLIGNAVAHLLVGTVFIAVGLFVSSLTENQLSAAIGTIAIIIGFLGIGLLGSLVPSSYWIRYVLDALSIFTRFQTFVNGYFDLASVVYYLTCTAVFLWLTFRVYDRRRFG